MATEMETETKSPEREQPQRAGGCKGKKGAGGGGETERWENEGMKEIKKTRRA